ncbi:MAG: hypothetical protein V4564_19465 [Pseudomonadota bacterium]|uniref:hypothetical protein n=1 Tax=Sphingomonas sp. ERG5 TaxID=1381597 RepID=UPI00054C4149|nr:hypothetical protein [Sphingomonas sp. ERG5]
MVLIRSFSRMSVALLFMIPIAAQAALPPYWQRAREIGAILESQDVARELRDAPIDSVKYVADDSYQASSGRCSVNVRVVGKARDFPGPRLFDLKVGKRRCTR